MYVDRGYSYEVNHGARTELSERDMNCLKRCYCSSTDTKMSKVFTITMYTATGAAIVGLATMGPHGILIGAVGGCIVGVVKVIYDHFKDR